MAEKQKYSKLVVHNRDQDGKLFCPQATTEFLK